MCRNSTFFNNFVIPKEMQRGNNYMALIYCRKSYIKIYKYLNHQIFNHYDLFVTKFFNEHKVISIPYLSLSCGIVLEYSILYRLPCYIIPSISAHLTSHHKENVNIMPQISFKHEKHLKE